MKQNITLVIACLALVIAVSARSDLGYTVELLDRVSTNTMNAAEGAFDRFDKWVRRVEIRLCELENAESIEAGVVECRYDDPPIPQRVSHVGE